MNKEITTVGGSGLEKDEAPLDVSEGLRDEVLDPNSVEVRFGDPEADAPHLRRTINRVA